MKGRQYVSRPFWADCVLLILIFVLGFAVGAEVVFKIQIEQETKMKDLERENIILKAKIKTGDKEN